MSLTLSVYIPTFNNSSTLFEVIKSIKSQKFPIQKISVFDDGSNKDPQVSCKKLKVFCKRFTPRRGRGFIRKESILDADSDLVLFCDATNILDDLFIENSISHFQDLKVAAVSGRISNHESLKGAVSDWRSRHLFKEKFDFGSVAQSAESLTTYGTILRRSSVLDVGNFNPSLEHSEDKELGERLISAGYKIIGDPNLVVRSIKKDSISSVLERYWRWYGGINERMTFRNYLHAIKASFRPMIQEDFKAGEWKSAIISLLCPHYGFLRSKFRNVTRKTQRPS